MEVWLYEVDSIVFKHDAIALAASWMTYGVIRQSFDFPSLVASGQDQGLASWGCSIIEGDLESAVRMTPNPQGP